jgi:hypothetical protein
MASQVGHVLDVRLAPVQGESKATSQLCLDQRRIYRRSTGTPLKTGLPLYRGFVLLSHRWMVLVPSCIE